MDKKIQEILNDVYLVDDSLREHEGRLITIVEELLQNRPDTKIDENFINELRQEIIGRAQAIKTEVPGQTEKTAGLFTWPKLVYALSGAAITILLVIPLAKVIYSPGSEISKMSADNILSLPAGTKIAKLKNEAFGPLGGGGGALGAPEGISAEIDRVTNSRGPASESALMFEAKTNIVEEEISDGAEIAPVPMDQALPGTAKGFGGGGGEIGRSMIAPDFVNYTYKYTGSALNLPGGELPVYRRVKDGSLSREVAKSISNTGLGLIEIDKFRNMGITNLQLVEDRDFGYMIFMNFEDNSMSVGVNWKKWPQPGSGCRDERCYESVRLKPGDMPSDDKIKSTAEKFLKDYGISTANYGEPTINDYWRREYELMSDMTRVYVPETVQVVYPVLLDGKTLYDDNGSKSGMTVEVNIRHAKVAGVHGLVIPKYEAANYKAASVDKIIEYAERGGSVYGNFYPEARDTIELKLGTPKLEMIRHWQYDQVNGRSTELYVPAYLFPVLNAPNDRYFYRTHVVVPVVADILDERGGRGDVDFPVPMPLMRGEVVPGGMPGEAPVEEMPMVEAEDY